MLVMIRMMRSAAAAGWGAMRTGVVAVDRRARGGSPVRRGHLRRSFCVADLWLGAVLLCDCLFNAPFKAMLMQRSCCAIEWIQQANSTEAGGELLLSEFKFESISGKCSWCDSDAQGNGSTLR